MRNVYSVNMYGDRSVDLEYPSLPNSQREHRDKENFSNKEAAWNYDEIAIRRLVNISKLCMSQ